MDSGGFTAVCKDAPLPLASLRLLVPPVQLMTASMWRVVQTQEVRNYWQVAQFVSVVMDSVPELLMYKHRTQLILGLRARYILELCRNESVEPDVVLSYLDEIKSRHSSKMEEAEEEEDAADRFLELIQTLLQNPEEREEFFLEDFPAVFGAQYASDLHTLFWEFLCRLAQLLPVPDLEQTVSWLGAESSVLEDCVHSLSKPTDLKHLLRHHKQLGHLEQHVPPSSMGDSIISSLSARPPSRVSTSTDQFVGSDSLQVLNVDSPAVSFVGDVAVEIISVTDYPEVELGASTEIEVVAGEGYYEGAADTQIVLPEETTREEKVEMAAQEKAEMVSMDIVHPEVNEDKVSASSQLGVSGGRHDCPDCEKKFKFASSLIAHRVIHTGERPHRCDACGRRFSFRQSLDRHRHTHKPGRMRGCVPDPNRANGQEAATCDNDDNEARGEVAEPVCPVRGGDGGDPDSGDADRPSGPAGLAPELDEEPVSAAKVRTSGRRRRPTMKIQVIDVQKQTKRRREVAKTNPPRPKPLPFACAEHSYGSPAVKDGKDSSAAEGSSAAFSCPKCSVQPSGEAQGDECLQLPDDRGGTYSCSDCDKSFKFQSLLKTHRLLHSGEQPFLCPQCGRRFSSKQSLERHKQTHRSGRKYECVICGEYFKSPAAQRDHQSSHMKDGEYLCSECGRAFAWKSALVRHLKTHSEDDDDDDESARSNKCPHCDLSFSCTSYLSRHLRTHQKEKEHACNCGKSFAYRSALTAHQRIHQKDRPHTCAQCGKGFLYKGGLLSHMKIHSEDMPFMCSYCGKSFKRERNMKKHERCHTRENVFSCSQCDKSFVYKATLIRHELTHSGERPYLCSDCGKGFFSHAELLKHERFHTGHKPFQCPHCGKRFTQSCYLTIHLRYHTGARPYSCSECDKSFLSANRLKRHQRTHSGERPYLCVECGKGFRQSYNLKMHQRTHTMK